MVKIKFKKEMNLPELIQWGWDNKAAGRFEGDKESLVLFDANSWVFLNKFICPEETFEVEVEEKITEETEIPTLIMIVDHGYGNNVTINNYCSIKDVFERFAICAKDITKAIYMLNDDMTMTLLWKDGEMIG